MAEVNIMWGAQLARYAATAMAVLLLSAPGVRAAHVKGKLYRVEANTYGAISSFAFSGMVDAVAQRNWVTLMRLKQAGQVIEIDQGDVVELIEPIIDEVTAKSNTVVMVKAKGRKLWVPTHSLMK